MGSDPKMPTAPRMTIGKLSAAFPALIPKGKASTMSWNDQVFAEEGRNLVFGPEIASQVTQRPQALMLGPLNMIHGSAESAPQLGRRSDMMERDSVTYNVTHNTDLWDSDHHTLSLFGYSGHLETDIKMLSSSLKHLACFIK